MFTEDSAAGWRGGVPRSTRVDAHRRGEGRKRERGKERRREEERGGRGFNFFSLGEPFIEMGLGKLHFHMHALTLTHKHIHKCTSALLFPFSYLRSFSFFLFIELLALQSTVASVRIISSAGASEQRILTEVRRRRRIERKKDRKRANIVRQNVMLFRYQLPQKNAKKKPLFSMHLCPLARQATALLKRAGVEQLCVQIDSEVRGEDK